MNSYLRAADRLPLRFNSAEWFVGRHVREGRAQSVAIIDGEGPLSYGELDEAVRRFAAAIRKAGVRRDERIAFITPGIPIVMEFDEYGFSLPRAGYGAREKAVCTVGNLRFHR